MFKVELAEHSLKDCSMTFRLSILVMGFRTYGRKFDVVHVNKLRKFLTIKFSSSINNQLGGRPRPLEPHVDNAVYGIFGGTRWGNASCLKASGPVYYVDRHETECP